MDLFLEMGERREGVSGTHYTREALQLLVLKVVSDDPELLDSLTLQGGTALRLCYGATRLSEDLDFVVGKEADRLSERLRKRIGELLKGSEIREKKEKLLTTLTAITEEGNRLKVKIARVPARTRTLKKGQKRHVPRYSSRVGVGGGRERDPCR